MREDERENSKEKAWRCSPVVKPLRSTPSIGVRVITEISNMDLMMSPCHPQCFMLGVTI